MDIHKIAKYLKKEFRDDGIVRTMDETIKKIPVFSTGILYIDWALGVGGFPRGRIVELFGPEACGKTTISLIVAGRAQKRGYNVLFIDAEHAFSPVYAESLGVDLGKILISQPEIGEDALQLMADTLDYTDEPMLIVLDSIASLVPKSEFEEDMSKQSIGVQARMLSKALRKLDSKVSRSGSLAIFTNQIRERIGIFWGNPETTPGGRALRHYASVRLEIKPRSAIKDSRKKRIGQQIQVTVVKSKVAVPYNVARYDFIYGYGIDKEKAFMDCLVELKLAKLRKGGYTYGDIVGDADEVYDSIGVKGRKKIKKKIFGG